MDVSRHRHLLILPLLASFAVDAPAHAYETDQLTDRNAQLADALQLANARMDTLLGKAISSTNRHLGCKAGMERTRQVLAKHVFDLTSKSKFVWSRGLLRMWGFTSISAWMENAPVQKRNFHQRYDIYSGLSLRESVILNIIGPCATMNVGGTLVGTDKFDHFFSLGYEEYRASGWGANVQAGLEYGTTSERTYFGTLTSRTFSFADLRANYDGFQFYLNLLEPNSIVELGSDGCARQTHPWDWSQILTWEYDELLNPSVYAPLVQQGITRTLKERRDSICAEYAQWGGKDYLDLLANVLAAWPPYVVGAAPARSDPFQLEALCHGDPLYAQPATPSGAVGTTTAPPPVPSPGP